MGFLTKEYKEHQKTISKEKVKNSTPPKSSEDESELNDLLKDLLTDETPVPDIEPVVRIDNCIYAVRGEISFIVGPPKAGKSAVCLRMVAGAFMKNPNLKKTLSIQTEPANGRNVIYIDTEQHKSQAKALMKKICWLAGLDKRPANLWVFHWREHSHQERRRRLELIFKHFENIHLLVLDGITDLLDSVNNEVAANELINFLMANSSKKEVAIISLIHEKGNTGNARGHIGAESERKCAGSIVVGKNRENNTHSISSKMIRYDGDFSTVYFQYDPIEKDYTLVSEQVRKLLESEGQQSKEERDKATIATAIKRAFGTNAELSKKDLKTAIMNTYKVGEVVSDKTADRAFNKAFELEIIIETANKNFKLS